MSFLAPYMDTSQKEHGTKPQGFKEQGEALLPLTCHLLQQRSWNYISLMGWIRTCLHRRACTGQSAFSTGACSLGMLMPHMHLFWLNLTRSFTLGVHFASASSSLTILLIVISSPDVRHILITCGELTEMRVNASSQDSITIEAT